MTDRPEHRREVAESDEELAEELDEEATAHNPDETTRREVLELELEEEGRSDLGAEIGDEIP